MKMKKTFIILLFTFSINSVFADSPLTSTDFYKAYLDIPLIQKTANSKGILTDEVFEYLTSKNSLDKKVALINALKWDINGKNNSTIYIKKLLVLHKNYTLTNFYQKATPEELLCYGYLKAMDDYFDVKKASVFTSRAQKLNPGSYTIAVINHLITAQMTDRNNWCERYSGFDTIKQNKLLKIDFRTKASFIIYEYLKEYKDYCTTWYSVKKFFRG
jgi:hypothetical protein